MIFKEKIEALLKKYGLSKREFCRKTGITDPALHGYLYRGGMPTLYNAIRIADAFNLSLDYFREDTDRSKNADDAFKKALELADTYYDKWTYDQKVKLIKSIL